MAEFGRLIEVIAPGAGGRGLVQLVAAELEGNALGIGFTQREGAEVRQLAVEMIDLADIQSLHDCIGQFLAKHRAK